MLASESRYGSFDMTTTASAAFHADQRRSPLLRQLAEKRGLGMAGKHQMYLPPWLTAQSRQNGRRSAGSKSTHDIRAFGTAYASLFEKKVTLSVHR